MVAELDRGGVRSRAGFRIGVGALAHLLRNRFYVGEVAYRGEIHPGPQPPIVDRMLFDAVQARLDAQAIDRRRACRDVGRPSSPDCSTTIEATG